MRNWLAIFVVCSSALACSREQPPPQPSSDLSVQDAWARAADSGANSAVYFTLANAGGISDTLTGASSDDAERTELHVSTQHEGMMHMTPVTQLPVPAADSVSFRPLGAHVMLSGVRRAAVEGDTLAVMLRFVSGKSVMVRAGVRAP